MKKFLVSFAVLAAVVSMAFAGFDQYTSKNYTTLLNPSAVNDLNVTNSVTTGVDVVGLPGVGSVVFSYLCNNAAGAILKFQLASSATTNGTYSIYTNSDGVASWSYTNAAGFGRIQFKPNTVSRYMRVYVTPTAVTNGVAGAILVTE